MVGVLEIVSRYTQYAHADRDVQDLINILLSSGGAPIRDGGIVSYEDFDSCVSGDESLFNLVAILLDSADISENDDNSGDDGSPDDDSGFPNYESPLPSDLPLPDVPKRLDRVENKQLVEEFEGEYRLILEMYYQCVEYLAHKGTSICPDGTNLFAEVMQVLSKKAVQYSYILGRKV